MAYKMTVGDRKREQQWQAEDDARTMALYQEIIDDKARMNRATKVARQQAADLQKRANAMQSVANRSSKPSTSTRKTKK